MRRDVAGHIAHATSSSMIRENHGRCDGDRASATDNWHRHERAAGFGRYAADGQVVLHPAIEIVLTLLYRRWRCLCYRLRRRNYCFEAKDPAHGTFLDTAISARQHQTLSLEH